MRRLTPPIALLFIFSLLLGILTPLRQAHAAVPVDETNPTLLIDAAIQQWWINIDRVLVAALKHQLLQTLSNMSLSWIQGGGDPRFITDWGRYLGNAAFGAAAKWFKDISGINICEPYRLGLTQIFRPTNISLPQFECTLDRFLAGTGGLGNRIEIFRNNFAAGGGWEAWLATLGPENNPYLIAYNGIQEQALRLAAADEAAKAEGIANEGAFGERKCLETYVDDFTGEETCIQWQITTPGSLVDEIVGRYLAGPDIDYIVNTDDLTNLIAAFTNLMLNRVIGSGEEGILGLQPQGIPPGGTFTKSGCEGLVGEAKTICEQEQASEPVCGSAFQPFIDVLVETKNIKQGSTTDLTTLIATFEQINAARAQQQPPICPDKTAEIISRQAQKTQIQQDIQTLNTDIQTFSNASCDFVPPKTLGAYRGERDGAQAEKAAIQAAITAAQSELAACTTPLP